MKTHLQNICLMLAALLVGCGDSPTAALNDDLLTEFGLRNVAGETTTTFQVGQDIHFHYAINNISGEAQPFMRQDTGPIAEFEIFRQGVRIGSSLDDLNFIPLIKLDTLAAGGQITLDYNWFAMDAHEPLAAGEYTARVTPRAEFSDVTSPTQQEMQFSVVSAGNRDSDTTAAVGITDVMPAALQLDPFTLNSVTVDGSVITLDVSYSGGCQEHDFALIMTPAAFMESQPVQANLYLRHDAKGDLCEALLTKNLQFDLTPVAELYDAFFNRQDEIILNVFEYFDEQPDKRLQVRFFPE